MFNLQRKLTHFPRKFLQNPPQFDNILKYIVLYSTVEIIHCTVVGGILGKNKNFGKKSAI